MNADTHHQPVPWHLALLAIIPGVLEVLRSIWETQQTHIEYSIDPILIACPLIAVVAFVQWWRTQSFPVWGLMPIGTVAASGMIFLIVGIGTLFGVVGGPAGPGFDAHTFMVNTAFLLQMGLTLGLSIWGYVRWGRTHRPHWIIWVLVAAAFLLPLLGNAGMSFFSAYWLMALGIGLHFAPWYRSSAVLVFIGVLLGWMWIMDIDYALGMYFTEYWVIDLYNVAWRVLVFVIGPLLLMRLPTRTARFWGGVLPIAAALIMERSFHWLVKPGYTPEHWLPFAITALLDPITLAVAVSLLLSEPPIPPQEAAPAPSPSSIPELQP